MNAVMENGKRYLKEIKGENREWKNVEQFIFMQFVLENFAGTNIRT